MFTFVCFLVISNAFLYFDQIKYSFIFINEKDLKKFNIMLTNYNYKLEAKPTNHFAISLRKLLIQR